MLISLILTLNIILMYSCPTSITEEALQRVDIWDLQVRADNQSKKPSNKLVDMERLLG